jgi:hypothetical protein
VNDPTPVDPTALLQGLAGTYLRNTRRDAGACTACCGPTNPGYALCYQCASHQRAGNLPNATGFSIYAAQGTQAGQLMHGYKAPFPQREHLVVMSLLLQSALTNHIGCPSRLVGTPVTHWATVPSTRGRFGAHPLHQMVTNLRHEPEAVLVHQPGVQPVRQRVVAGLFRSPVALVEGSHVLLVDDTWVSGGRALSAVHCLRDAGASSVSVLSIARWLSFDFIRPPSSGSISELHHNLLGQVVFSPAICPYTGGYCPSQY